MYRNRPTVLTVLLAFVSWSGEVDAQSMSLLGEVAIQATVPTTVDENGVIELARIIAAEAGGDAYSNPRAQTAVGAAMVNKIRQKYAVARVTGALVRKLTVTDEPWFISSRKDSNAYLYRKDAAWLTKNGFAHCLVAARAALSGDDPAAGGTNWHDTRIRTPYPGKTIVTARMKSGVRGLVFYRFRVPEA